MSTIQTVPQNLSIVYKIELISGVLTLITSSEMTPEN